MVRHKAKLLCLLSIFLTIACTTPSHAQFDTTDLLPVDQAFLFQSTLIDEQTLDFYWEIAPGYYLYKEEISILNSDNTELVTQTSLPAGTEKNDQVLGKLVVYSKSLDIKLPWSEDHKGNSILVKYQGCAESGFCFAPVNKQINIDANKKIEILDSDLEEFPAKESQVDQIADSIKERYLPLTLLIFFGLGILLSFTPCVLPMIPLVVNLIVGSDSISMRKALWLSGSYVIGMSSTYAIAGMIAGTLGAKFQSAMQQPVILIVFSLIMVLFALTQFEIIHLSVPTFNRKLHHWGQKQLQGSVIGAFILGIIASLLVSPCITPPLIGVLTYISQSGSPFIGGLTLLCLGLGMGVPLMIVAALSGVMLPSAGPWMNLIRTISGLGLLALAIWILGRVIPNDLSLVLWGILCIIAAYFLLRAHMVFKILGVCIAIFGAALIMLAANNKFDFLSAVYDKDAVQYDNLNWHTVNRIEDIHKFITEAKAKNKPALLEVSATWCTSCKRIEKGVFTNPLVEDIMEDFMLMKLDITKLNADKEEILKSFNIYGPPELIFFDSKGQELKSKRLAGNVSVDQLLEIITKI